MITSVKLILTSGLLAPMLLSGCITSRALPDPVVIALAQNIHDRSMTHHTMLGAARSPECDYESNKSFYSGLEERAAELRDHLAERRASEPLIRAAEALVRTIVDAAQSHQLASAVVDDVNDSCLAPVAIALNADAIARASAALAATQQSEGPGQ
jgi:hypothetical protein